MPTAARERIRDILNRANPGQLADALRLTKIGNQLTPITVVAAGLTLAAAFDITTAAFKALSTITGVTLADGENLPAIGSIVQLSIVTSGGTSDVGPRVLGLAAAALGAGSVGIATLSADGKTITFEGTCTAFTFTYIPRPAVSTDTLFAGEGA